LHNRQKTQKTQVPTTSTLAQQPSNKGLKRVIFHDDKQQCSPAAYHSNINMSQQELLRPRETYAHADMREIQQQIKNFENKAHREVATFQIPKCLSCSEKNERKDHANTTAVLSRKMITTRDLIHKLTM
jgi:hypothetical protein